jgi:hypothetical protein
MAHRLISLLGDRRLRAIAVVVAAGAALLIGVRSHQPVVAQIPPPTVSFQLFPANPTVAACLTGLARPRRAGGPPTVTANVTRGQLNDTMTISLGGFAPNVGFDVFTVQHSSLLANGSPDPNFSGFGLAWYQSDLESDGTGNGSATIQTILLDQIFGFDPAVSLAPTNTFHVGFWFNDPQQAFDLGCETSPTPVVTPFNGEHHAGPLAFITVPSATTGLGPLCTKTSCP